MFLGLFLQRDVLLYLMELNNFMSRETLQMRDSIFIHVSCSTELMP